jgi:hypothetical protein
MVPVWNCVRTLVAQAKTNSSATDAALRIDFCATENTRAEHLAITHPRGIVRSRQNPKRSSVILLFPPNCQDQSPAEPVGLCGGWNGPHQNDGELNRKSKALAESELRRNVRSAAFAHSQLTFSAHRQAITELLQSYPWGPCYPEFAKRM